MNETNAASAELLSQLRDIHGAAPPGWWPPAPGWWVLAALVLLVVFFALRALARRWAAHRRKQALLRALEHIARQNDPSEQPHAYLAELNRLFRVVALQAFPGTAASRLQGEEWVSFLRSMLPDKTPSAGLAALAVGPYRPQPEFDADELHALARRWVKTYG